MSSKRRLKRRREGVKPSELITKGYMKIGPDYNQDWRGWPVYRVLPDPADDYEPVRIVKGH